MKAADFDILTVPGWTSAGPGHWLSRWEAKLSTARRVDQADWETPRLEDWVATLEQAASEATKPIVFVAHSCGVTALVHAASLPGSAVAARTAGAFLVAPPDHDADSESWLSRNGGFVNPPMQPLPFPCEVVASANDPHCALNRAEAFAASWGAKLRHAGEAGQINTASGHGPWPEGSLAFALFLKLLRQH
jgi:predicted alpha/beta hydrolase family esterase